MFQGTASSRGRRTFSLPQSSFCYSASLSVFVLQTSGLVQRFESEYTALAWSQAAREHIVYLSRNEDVNFVHRIKFFKIKKSCKIRPFPQGRMLKKGTPILGLGMKL